MTHPPDFSDIDPETMKASIEKLRKMTPGEKLKAVFELTDFAIKISEMAERARHPNASDREIFLRAASRRLDRDLMIRVYGWDPAAYGEPCSTCVVWSA